MFANKTFILMTTALTILFAVGMTKWAIAPVVIAAGISALSNLVGQGVSSAQNKENQNARERYLNRRRQEEDNWYNRNYNADPTQRADAQRAINMVSEEMKRNNRATAGRAAMGGATEEAVAREKELGNQAVADVVSSIAAEGSRRKDAIDAQHHQAVQGINDAEFNMQQAEAARKAQNLQTAVTAAGNVAAAIAGNTGNDAGAETPATNAAPVASAPTSGEGSTTSTTQLNTTPPAPEMQNPDAKSSSIMNRYNQMKKIY
jgi:hypothetical protein